MDNNQSSSSLDHEISFYKTQLVAILFNSYTHVKNFSRSKTNILIHIIAEKGENFAKIASTSDFLYSRQSILYVVYIEQTRLSKALGEL